MTAVLAWRQCRFRNTHDRLGVSVESKQAAIGSTTWEYPRGILLQEPQVLHMAELGAGWRPIARAGRAEKTGTRPFHRCA
jgi:hypothetical protein